MLHFGQVIQQKFNFNNANDIKGLQHISNSHPLQKPYCRA